jgi:hypothetical protein
MQTGQRDLELAAEPIGADSIYVEI